MGRRQRTYVRDWRGRFARSGSTKLAAATPAKTSPGGVAVGDRVYIPGDTENDLYTTSFSGRVTAVTAEGIEVTGSSGGYRLGSTERFRNGTKVIVTSGPAGQVSRRI